MHFTNFSDFIFMGGHGLYVWMAFAFTFFWMIFLFISPLVKKSKIINSIIIYGNFEKIKNNNNLE